MEGFRRFANVRAVNTRSSNTLRAMESGRLLRDARSFFGWSPMKTASPSKLPLNTRNKMRAARFIVPRWKRSLDVTLILITAPVWALAMAAIALLIKLLSRGPPVGQLVEPPGHAFVFVLRPARL